MSSSVAHLNTMLARNTKILKAAWKQASRIVETHVSAPTRVAQSEFHSIFVPKSAKHSIPRIAAVRQGKGRWYSTHTAINSVVRRFTTVAQQAYKHDRASSLPKSHIGNVVRSSTRRVPFATVLRPNLTSGTLSRTAGGYGIGGSARYFSHTPAAPAQVVNNVSQAIRAFILSGKRAQFDGVDPHTREKKYKLITPLQRDIGHRLDKFPQATPGSFIDFTVNPTITALAPHGSVAGLTPAQCLESIDTDGLLDVLAADFSRSLTELSAVFNDIKRLSSLGHLPITYRTTSLRIHFPGCDQDTVTRLCDELGVSRGVVAEDATFASFTETGISLQFPYAPSCTSREPSAGEGVGKVYASQQAQILWGGMTSRPGSKDTHSVSRHFDADHGFEHVIASSTDPWLSPASNHDHQTLSDISGIGSLISLDYESFEGINRFMEQCQPSS